MADLQAKLASVFPQKGSSQELPSAWDTEVEIEEGDPVPADVFINRTEETGVLNYEDLGW